MVDYAPLAQELQNPAYAGMADEQILSAINAKTVAARQVISASAVKQYMIRQGVLGTAFVVANDAGGSPQVRAACVTVREGLLNDAFSSFDLDDPEAKAEIDALCAALIGAGCMTADQQTAVYAMADTTQPWTLSVGLPTPIGDGDLENARNLAQ